MQTLSLELLRVGQSPRGTFGVLRRGDIPFALTLERPWGDNASQMSCIPAGVYQCRKIRSPKFGVTFEVLDVPDRSHILFHKGNTIEDTQGCILIGEEFSGTYEQPRIASSERGFLEFMTLLQETTSFDLIIVDPPPIYRAVAV